MREYTSASCPLTPALRVELYLLIAEVYIYTEFGIKYPINFAKRCNLLRLLGTTIGILVIGLSSYWGYLDFANLTEANQQLEKSHLEISEREFRYLLSREEAHRINVGFEGTWLLLGVIIILLSNRRMM